MNCNTSFGSKLGWSLLDLDPFFVLLNQNIDLQAKLFKHYWLNKPLQLLYFLMERVEAAHFHVVIYQSIYELFCTIRNQSLAVFSNERQ
jgi:hypothetical protein